MKGTFLTVAKHISELGHPTPTHNTPAHSLRRLFGSIRLLQEQ